MIVLLSPAKNLDPNAKPVEHYGIPELIEGSKYLAKKLKPKSAKVLSKMMGINPELGKLNHDRYQKWEYPFPNGQAFEAIHLFNGEVYRGLDSASFTDEDLSFAQRHLLILSGLYGLLKPLDGMLPYRLEMGTRWAVTPSKKNLYAFWGNRVTEKLNEALESDPDPVVVNLASAEYFKAVKTEKLEASIITPVFKDLKNGEYKNIMTYSKLARGYMSRYIVKERIEKVDALKDFKEHGYSWNEELSNGSEWVFARDLQ